MRIPNRIKKTPKYYIRTKNGKAIASFLTLEQAHKYINYLYSIEANEIEQIRDIVLVNKSGMKIVETFERD